MAYSSNRENNRDTLVYIHKLVDSLTGAQADSEPFTVSGHVVTPLGGAVTARWIAESLSADDRQLIVTSWQSSSIVTAYIVDISDPSAPSQPRKIVLPGVTESEDQITMKSLSFSEDPATPNLVYMVTNAYGDFASVVVYDSVANTVIHITTPEPGLDALRPVPWDTSALTITEKIVYFRANVHGWDVLYAMPLIGPHAHKVLEVDLVDWEGGELVFQPNDSNGFPFELALGLKSHRSSGYIAHADLSALEGTESGLEVEPAGLNAKQPREQKITVQITPYPQAMASAPTYPTNGPKLVTFGSFDGLEIPVMYYPPINRPGPVPLIINIHGGPASQAKAAYRRYADPHLLIYLSPCPCFDVALI